MGVGGAEIRSPPIMITSPPRTGWGLKLFTFREAQCSQPGPPRLAPHLGPPALPIAAKNPLSECGTKLAISRVA
jgi:hypothetical protein